MNDSDPTWRHRMTPRIPAIVFGTVFVLGLVLIGVQTARHWRQLGADPFVARTEETKVVTTDANGKVTSTEVTTKPADSSLVEQALASGGLLFVRVALVALGAFVAGGITQRVLNSNYAVKLGAFELPESVEEAGQKATAAINDLSARVDTLETLNAQVANVNVGIGALADELLRIEEELAELKARPPGTRPGRPR